MAAKLNLIIEQGATFDQVFTVKDENGTAINLTGYTFAGKIRKTYSDPVVAATFTFTLLNQTTYTGKVRAVIAAATTAALKVDPASSATRTYTEYCYDFEMTAPDTTVKRILEGLAKVSPEVTR